MTEAFSNFSWLVPYWKLDGVLLGGAYRGKGDLVGHFCGEQLVAEQVGRTRRQSGRDAQSRHQQQERRASRNVHQQAEEFAFIGVILKDLSWF